MIVARMIRSAVRCLFSARVQSATSGQQRKWTATIYLAGVDAQFARRSYIRFIRFGIRPLFVLPV